MLVAQTIFIAVVVMMSHSHTGIFLLIIKQVANYIREYASTLYIGMIIAPMTQFKDPARLIFSSLCQSRRKVSTPQDIILLTSFPKFPRKTTEIQRFTIL